MNPAPARNGASVATSCTRSNMKLTGGYTNYEQVIGVLMLDTRFPRPPGDIGNAASYRFPVRYKKVQGAVTTKIMGREPEQDLLRPLHRGRDREGDHHEL